MIFPPAEEIQRHPHRTMETESPAKNKRQKKEPTEPHHDQNQEATTTSRRWCGICLSEGKRGIIRAEIDSCDHYFCFVCIMEWAKVESRCPICKRRFNTIRRPPFPGIFPLSRIVRVPHRDQMSYLSWVTTVGPFDPYEQVRCMVCQSSADDYLLLLCDLCDSAAHTYCIGLGATGPDGDWFCKDCTIIRAECDENQRDSVDDDNVDDVIGSAEESIVGNSDVVRSDEGALVSILDIVHESDLLMLGWSQNVSSRNLIGNNVDRTNKQAFVAENFKEISSGVINEANSTDEANRAEARTLRQCRNVGSYIRSLRENWDALRRGSLSFSSCSAESTGKSHGKPDNFAVPCDSSGKAPILYSTKSQPPTALDSVRGSARHGSYSYDVEKAWKMLDRAKSARRTRESAKKVQDASNYLAVRRSTIQESSGKKQTPPCVPSYSLGSELDSRNLKQLHNHYAPGKEEREKCISQQLEKQQLIQDDLTKYACSPPWMEQTRSRGVMFLENKLEGLQKNATNHKPNSSAYSSTSRGVSGVCDMYKDRSDLGNFGYLGSKKLSRQSNAPMIDCMKGKAERDDDAKRTIQSLVKLNLKLLSRDDQLGVGVFKEIARLATHTILAACDLEHSRSASYSFTQPVCHHSEKEQQLCKSVVMPKSCRECFFSFVKDVVNLILSENLCHLKSHKSFHLA